MELFNNIATPTIATIALTAVLYTLYRVIRYEKVERSHQVYQRKIQKIIQADQEQRDKHLRQRVLQLEGRVKVLEEATLKDLAQATEIMEQAGLTALNPQAPPKSK